MKKHLTSGVFDISKILISKQITTVVGDVENLNKAYSIFQRK